MSPSTFTRRLLPLLALCACKVPITDINAGFTLSEAAWFEAEETLFFFWRLEAEQGLGELSQLEVTYRTDEVVQGWAAVGSLPEVHTHLPVDCGVNGRCGSTSLKVEKLPRQVGLRLRYHRDGELFLTAPLNFNVVGVGPPHTHRSLVAYGVFDETNTRVQWRARHQFPTLRNHEVEALGLRRSLRVLSPAAGDVSAPPDNPYGYGMVPGCPAGLMPLNWAELTTTDRAAFAPETMPLSASTVSGVCARSIVTDANGNFEAAVVARKNPEVRPAFPLLRSPIREDTKVGFLLKPCNRDISTEHLDMQTQRLQLESAPTVCIDDVRAPGFAGTLAATFRTRVDAARAAGRDMVLTVSLHHDDSSGVTAAVLEDALSQVLAPELGKTTPRLVGAFVFDSYAYQLVDPVLKRTVLWCPAKLPLGFDGGFDDLEAIPDTAQRTCPLLPDLPDLNLGPFRFGTLPILPTRQQYLTFIGKYSAGQAGSTTNLSFKAPELTPVSQNVAIGDFGVATFFNNESLAAAPADAFSFCASMDLRANLVVFRVPLAPDAPLPISALPDVHAAFPQPSYSLGLGWDFPFLTRLDYQVTVAGAATAFSVTVPFGISGMNMQYYGTQVWAAGEFPIADVLAQCTRFCDNPTFDSGGVYNVAVTFRDGFRQQCYRPLYPKLDGGGFPLDP